MKKFIYILLVSQILCFTSQVCSAQNKDSLWAIYNNKTQADTVRIKAIDVIAYSYRSNNSDTAIILAQQELKFISTVPSAATKKWIASAYNTISVAYRNKSNYPQAMDYALKALKQNQEINDKKGIAHNYISIGLVCDNQSDFAKALDYYEKALQLRQEMKDKSGIADCYNRMGLVYTTQSNFTKALDYDLKSLQLREELGDKKGIADCYMSIASVYTEQSDPKAFNYYAKGLKLCKEIGYKRGVGICYCNMGALYNKLANYKAAIQCGDTGVIVGKEIKALDMERVSYSILATAYSKIGKYKEAYENHVKYKQLTDSIFSTDNSKKLNDIANNFEAEKKAVEQAKLDAIALEEKKRQQVIIYAVAGVLLIVFVFSVSLYRRFKITQKQKIIIEKQKEVVEEQKQLVEQQKQKVDEAYDELHEKNKEVMDSIRYAKRIQTALITSEKNIENSLKRLMKKN